MKKDIALTKLMKKIISKIVLVLNRTGGYYNANNDQIGTTECIITSGIKFPF
jgi:hypothetical protein